MQSGWGFRVWAGAGFECSAVVHPPAPSPPPTLTCDMFLDGCQLSYSSVAKKRQDQLEWEAQCTRSRKLAPSPALTSRLEPHWRGPWERSAGAGVRA